MNLRTWRSGVSSPYCTFVLYLYPLTVMAIITKSYILFIFIHLKISIIYNICCLISFLFRFYLESIFSFETQTHHRTFYFVIVLYVLDECPPPCFWSVIVQGVAHLTPPFADSLFQSLSKALKGKILLFF